MANEDLVFDGYAFADERMGRNLAPGANLRPFLDFDESANASIVANPAAINVYEFRLKDLDIPTEFNIDDWHFESPGPGALGGRAPPRKAAHRRAPSFPRYGASGRDVVAVVPDHAANWDCSRD